MQAQQLPSAFPTKCIQFIAEHLLQHSNQQSMSWGDKDPSVLKIYSMVISVNPNIEHSPESKKVAEPVFSLKLKGKLQVEKIYKIILLIFFLKWTILRKYFKNPPWLVSCIEPRASLDPRAILCIHCICVLAFACHTPGNIISYIPIPCTAIGTSSSIHCVLFQISGWKCEIDWLL